MQHNLNLAYLMCSRLCHDLAAPLSAISIGLDMLPESEDPDGPQKILQYSVKSAINKLELLRCLSGYTNSPKKPTFTDAVRIINKSIDLDKYHIDWLCRIEDSILGNAVRLIVAIILIAIDSLPRGGKIAVHPDFSIEIMGPYIKLNEEVIEALTGKASYEDLTSRGIIGHLAYLLSRDLETKVTYQIPQPNQIVFKFS